MSSFHYSFGFVMATKLGFNQAEVLELLIRNAIHMSRVRHENPDAISFTVQNSTVAKVEEALTQLFKDKFTVRRMQQSGTTVDVFHLRIPERLLDMHVADVDLKRLSDGVYVAAFRTLGEVLARRIKTSSFGDVAALSSRTVKVIHAAVRAAGEELSPAQEGYQDFFKDKLEDAGISSPAELETEQDKKEFFNDVKQDWPQERMKIMTQAARAVPLTALHMVDSGNYLLKITAENHLPTRNEIVAWCKNNGLSISAADIRIRRNVLRVQALEGSLKVKPVAGLMQALQDDSPEFLMAEVGDHVDYMAHGMRASGSLKAFAGNGIVIIGNDLTKEDDQVPFAAVLKVTGHAVEAAESLTAEQLVKRQLNI